MKNALFYITLFFWVVPPAYGQRDDTTRTAVRDDVEEVMEFADPDNMEEGSEQLIQYLQELSENPVNVNSAGVDELLRIPGLSLKTAQAIIDYRENSRPFASVDELREVRGIGRVTLEKVRPYVTPGRGLELGKTLYLNPRYWTSDGEFQAFSRYQQDLQRAKGYGIGPEEGGYAGSPVKYYQRFGYRSDHMSMNITQEKDAGEQLIDPLHFDHNSGHFALRDNGKLKMLVGGDYSLAFGQGLVLWSGATFGKGSDVKSGVSKNGRGIKPYISSQETNFNRGAAVTYGDKLQLTAFYSGRKLNATRVSDDTTRYPASSGYKRTKNEYLRENTLGQKLYGGHIQAAFPFGIMGLTGYRTIFDRYIVAGDQPYAKYDFEGRSHSAIGFDYRLLAGPAVIFGEAARTVNGGMGFISGLESPIGDHTDISVAYRHYQKDFQSILGNGFGEASGEPKNERGIYMGMHHAIGDKITLDAYVDQFYFPHARFGTQRPTEGYEMMGKAEVALTKDLNMYIRIRSEIEEDEYVESDAYGRALRLLGKARRSTYRANLEYEVNDRVRLRTRGEVVQSKSAGEQPETGYLLYQDIRLNIHEQVQLDMRLTMFDTESYGSRLYQFENDLLYVFAIQPLYNTGQRIYLLLNYEPFDFLELWAKFGLTAYEDEQLTGSGMNQVEGDKRSEMGIQARVRF